MEEKHLREAADLIRRSRKFLVACHVRPDGDALGSALALANALRQMDKDVTIVAVDGVPDLYTFLPDSDEIVRETSDRDFDVSIVVDCDGIERVGDALDTVRSARFIIAIDHHAYSPPFGNIGLYDPSAAATCEIVIDLIDRLGVMLDESMASCLMTGIVSDTGAFRFANVTPRTFLHAARLAAAGASPSAVARLVYESRSPSSARLLGIALAGLKMNDHARLVWSTLSLDDFRTAGASEADTDGIINHITAIRGAQVAILFREASDGATLVSLRSKGSVDVREIAKVFGGGGHAAAAGCTVQSTLLESERIVIEETRKCMGS
jgi:bifunctional oligoribonuclease and PAP phosphatase NrnA